MATRYPQLKLRRYLDRIGYRGDARPTLSTLASLRRDQRGDTALSNHLCLLVREPDARQPVYLADVGFGGSMIAPIELTEFEHSQVPFSIGLRFFDNRYWRFFEESANGASNYDFVPNPADESSMAEKCEQLQSDPQSSFVLNLVVNKRLPDAHVCLRGRVLATTTVNGKRSVLLETAEELATTVSELVGLDVPGVADLWSKIVARHEQWSGT